MKLKTACLLISLLACGCATTPHITSSANVQVVAAAELPAPTIADLYGQTQPYIVGPLDRLRIDVFGIPELSARVVQVDSSGNVSFPLVGVMSVNGKTPAEVGTLIEHALRANFIRNPQVSVNLEQAQVRGVTVYGEVREPGVYPINGRMSLLRAIASAKGLGEFARQDEVIVFRTVGNQNLAAVYSLRAIRSGAYPDPEIYANDVVAVGDNPSRRVFRDLINAASLITTPLIILLQR
jgi:polysaccharide export outer membrane protein